MGLAPDRDQERSALQLRYLFLPMLALLALLVIVRLYQTAFAYKHGLDSTAPEYARYWYPWLAFNTVGIGTIMLGWWIWLARTRCGSCLEMRRAGTVDRTHQLAHVWRLFSLIVGLAFFFFMAILMAEQDAGWHQTSLRDTSFTPIHIFLFYMTFPVILGMTISAFLYARTRVPEVWGKSHGVPLSFTMMISAFVLNFMNVAFNEFGHGEWIFEEKFSNPMHWPFVGFSLVAASLFSVVLEALDHVISLSGRGDTRARRDPVTNAA